MFKKLKNKKVVSACKSECYVMSSYGSTNLPIYGLKLKQVTVPAVMGVGLLI